MAKNLKTEDYVTSVASAVGFPKNKTREVLKEFLHQVAENTATGIPSQFVGLGKIEIREVSDAVKRNPRTGAEVQVEAHQKPKFQFSGKVRNTLRGLVGAGE